MCPAKIAIAIKDGRVGIVGILGVSAIGKLNEYLPKTRERGS